MFKLFQFLLCCCAIGLSLCKTEEEVKQYFMKLGIQCSRDYMITPTEMVMLQKHEMPDSENARCLMACVYRKAIWMDEKGMFDEAGAQTMAEKHHGDDTKMIENSKKLFDHCKTVNDATVADGEKGCDRAALLFKCLTENAPKFSENTFKHYYFPENKDISSDEEGTVGHKIKEIIARKRQANNIDGFFEKPKKKPKVIKKSSSVSRSSSDGVAFISSGQDDGAYASHLIKIEVYDMEKIRNIAPADHWKHCDVRLKYYSVTEDDSNVQSARDVIFNITKQLAAKENCVRNFIETYKK